MFPKKPVMSQFDQVKIEVRILIFVDNNKATMFFDHRYWAKRSRLFFFFSKKKKGTGAEHNFLR